MVWVGLGLQFAGFALAAWALAFEWRERSEIEAPQMQPARSRRQNPWRAKLSLPRYNRTVQRLRRTEHQASLGTRGTDPDIEFSFEFFGKWLNEREQLLIGDWDQQRTEDDAIRLELQRLFNEQARLLVEQQNRTQARVLWEMSGLGLAILGTVVGTVAGLG